MKKLFNILRKKCRRKHFYKKNDIIDNWIAFQKFYDTATMEEQAAAINYIKEL